MYFDINDVKIHKNLYLEHQNKKQILSCCMVSPSYSIFRTHKCRHVGLSAAYLCVLHFVWVPPKVIRLWNYIGSRAFRLRKTTFGNSCCNITIDTSLGAATHYTLRRPFTNEYLVHANLQGQNLHKYFEYTAEKNILQSVFEIKYEINSQGKLLKIEFLTFQLKTHASKHCQIDLTRKTCRNSSKQMRLWHRYHYNTCFSDKPDGKMES